MREKPLCLKVERHSGFFWCDNFSDLLLHGCGSDSGCEIYSVEDRISIVDLENEQSICQTYLITGIEDGGALQSHSVEKGTVCGGEVFQEKGAVRCQSDHAVLSGNLVFRDHKITGFASAYEPLTVDVGIRLSGAVVGRLRDKAFLEAFPAEGAVISVFFQHGATVRTIHSETFFLSQ